VKRDHTQENRFNPELQKAINFLRENPDTYTFRTLRQKFPNLTEDQLRAGYRRYKDQYKLRILKDKKGEKPSPRIHLQNRVERKRNTKNVLVIGDLHEPFTLDGYLEFCLYIQKKYQTTHTIFIGDELDAHAVSYHDHDPDGYSAGHELERAIEKLEPWVEAFPVADVCIGNHTRLVARKAVTGGIPSAWLRSYSDVLGAPSWEFREEFIYDNVKYVHGEQGSARIRARKDLISTVQGHRHPEAYVEHIVGETFHIFGMQVGCGIDRRAYAFNYAKAGTKPAISVGVVLDHGRLPIVEMAQLSGGVIITT
jgi:hypothetical protein